MVIHTHNICCKVRSCGSYSHEESSNDKTLIVRNETGHDSTHELNGVEKQGGELPAIPTVIMCCEVSDFSCSPKILRNVLDQNEKRNKTTPKKKTERLVLFLIARKFDLIYH